MDTKQCYKCNEVKPMNMFYAHRMMKDGYLNKCKECCKSDNVKNRQEKIDQYREYDRNRSMLDHRVSGRKEYTDKMRTEHKEQWTEMRRIATAKYRKKYPERASAKRRLMYAIMGGKINKECCSVCGDNSAEGHHPDYSKPLSVIWLCDKHHKEIHKKERDKIRGNNENM